MEAICRVITATQKTFVLTIDGVTLIDQHNDNDNATQKTFVLTIDCVTFIDLNTKSGNYIIWSISFSLEHKLSPNLTSFTHLNLCVSKPCEGTLGHCW